MNQTECKNEAYRFQAVGKREVVGEFNGGHVSSDAGLVLLGEVEKRRRIIKRLGECFIDYRDQRYCEHSVEQLLKQRIYGIAAWIRRPDSVGGGVFGSLRLHSNHKNDAA